MLTEIIVYVTSTPNSRTADLRYPATDRNEPGAESGGNGRVCSGKEQHMTHDILLKIILTAVGLLTTGAMTRSNT